MTKSKTKKVKVKAWARVCVNKVHPCGLIETTLERIKTTPDEICVPCEITYKI